MAASHRCSLELTGFPFDSLRVLLLPVNGQTDTRQQQVPPAELPRGEEQEVAAGRVSSTPFTMINRVALMIALVAGIALGIVVVAYLVA